MSSTFAHSAAARVPAVWASQRARVVELLEALRLAVPRVTG
jgi:hypothetical protein